MSWTIQAGGIAVGLLAAGSFLVADRSLNPPELRVEIVALEYVEIEGRGAIRQDIEVSEPVEMQWTAQIVRPPAKELCSGSGVAPYVGEETTWFIDDWTGDDCGTETLQEGDRFKATWTYRDQNGFFRRISGARTVGDAG